MRRHHGHHPHLAGYHPHLAGWGPDCVGAYHPHLAGYDTVGFGFGNILHALNPINVVKAAGQMVATPLQLAYGLGKNVVQAPFKLIGGETRALQNLFGAGGGSAPQQPQQPGYPPGYGPPAGWAAAPQQPPPGYGPPPGWGAPPPGYGMPPMAPPSTPQYDPNAYLAQTAPPLQMYGDSTGWDASYGGSSGAGW